MFVFFDESYWQSASFVISLSRHIRALTDVQILGVIMPDICVHKQNHQDSAAGQGRAEQVCNCIPLQARNCPPMSVIGSQHRSSYR